MPSRSERVHLMSGWSMTEDELDPPALKAAAKEEVRVVLPMEAWQELRYLADDSTEGPTDLPSVLLLARETSHGRRAPGDRR
jgi:hypothetical protein